MYIKKIINTHTHINSFICSSQKYLVVLAKRKILGAEWESAVHFPPCSACAPPHGAHVLPLSTQPASACIVICSALVLTIINRFFLIYFYFYLAVQMYSPCKHHYLQCMGTHIMQCTHTHPANTSICSACMGTHNMQCSARILTLQTPVSASQSLEWPLQLQGMHSPR